MAHVPDLRPLRSLDPTSLTRRTFLSAMTTVLGGVVLTCGESDADGPLAGPLDGGLDADGGIGQETASPEAGPSESYFDIWSQMRQAVRTSPDHLDGEAARAVATRDPTTIMRFVRDSIATIPLHERGFGDAATAVRWGVRGALRCGYATMREKADLLAELFVRAGWKAEVVVGSSSSINATTAHAVLERPIERTFEPIVADSVFDHWRQILGLRSSPPSMTPVDNAATATKALAATLLSALPTGIYPTHFDWGSLLRVPLVKAVIQGKETYANPNIPDAELGKTYTDLTPEPAPAAIAFEKVSISLNVRTTAAPKRPTVVAMGEFSVADLVGRQIVMQFVPAAPLASALNTPVKDIRSFIPILALRGPDLEAKKAGEASIAGGVLHLDGDFATVNADGKVTVNGQALETLAAPSDAIAKAKSIAMQIGATSFPSIRLRVSVLDGAGKAVSGLPASAFQVAEQGAAVPFLLTSNASSPPRVLFVVDTSNSLPATFRGAEAANVIRQIAEALLAQDSRCQFSAAAVESGITTPSAYTADLAVLEADCIKLSGYASALWKALAQASDRRPSAIVFITDGIAEDLPMPEELATISAGPPAVFLAVGTVDSTILAQMAAASNGIVFPVTQASEAVSSVSGFLKMRAAEPYTIQYTASEQGPTTRNVTVALASTSQKANGTYEVPAQASRTPRPVLCGIGLTIKYRDIEVTRNLAGHDMESSAAPSADDTERVRFALFGSSVISFEGEAPSISRWLDDLLTAKLSRKDFWDARKRADANGMLAAFSAGITYVPANLVPLHHPLAPSEKGKATTLTSGIRAVMLSSFLVPGKGLVQKADILPMTQFSTPATDDMAGFRQTVERSLLLGLVEKALYNASTAKALEGKTLRGLKSSPVLDIELSDWPEALRNEWKPILRPYADNINLVPSDGTPHAFWSIHRQTGTVVGVLPDGSGGGLSTDDKKLGNVAQNALGWASLAGELGGFGLAFGGFVALQKAILKAILAEADAVSRIGDDEAPPFSLTGPGCDFACDVVKGAVFDHYGLGSLSKLDAWAEALTGKSIPCGC